MTRMHVLVLGSALALVTTLSPAAALSGVMDDLLTAREALQNGQPNAARAALDAIDLTGLSVSEQALYYELRGQLVRSSDPSAAAEFYARANMLEERAYRRYEQALAHDEAGETGPALQTFARARELDPENVNILLSEAYALRRAGRDGLAAERFAQARAAGAPSVNVVLDEAYARRAAGDAEGAVALFRESVDLLGADPASDAAQLYGIRREIQTLEDRVDGEVFLAYRSEAFNSGVGLPEQGSAFNQAGARIAYRPEQLFRAGRGLSVYGRGFVTLEDDSLAFQEETLQFGLGASYKPFAGQNFNLAIERLIAGGDIARDAWLARASYGWSEGTDWNPVAESWRYTSLYADFAYILDEPEFTSVFASARHGRRFAVGNRRTLTPYGVLVAQWSDDSFVKRDRFEAGLGLAYSIWFDETAYTAPAQRVDFELEGRLASGDADDAIIARINWLY